MANSNAVSAGKIPGVTDSNLSGKPAKEYKFSVNGVNRVMVKVLPGPKPIAKAILATTPKGTTGFNPIRQAINLGFVKADNSPVTSEVARMLGDPDLAAALAHAAEILRTTSASPAAPAGTSRPPARGRPRR